MRKKTTEEFIRDAVMVHGDQYDYSKAVYRGNKVKLTIICYDHCEFEQTPANHLSGQGCPKCGKEKNYKSLRKTTDKFISEARSVHGDRYDYSKVDYCGAHIPVTIICYDHGEFLQLPTAHRKGHGCPKCSVEKNKLLQTKTTEQFISEARSVHGDRYDYSKTEYLKCDVPLIITCFHHGDFSQLPPNHLKGHGCPKCAGVYKKDTDDFILEARLVHGDKYDYSKTVYVNAKVPVKITCLEHGVFEQMPYVHIRGSGCPMCYNEKSSQLRTKTTEQFIKDSKRVHGNRYDYSKTKYIGVKKPVIIICETHGEFIQIPSDHLSGCGCPKCFCSHKTSKSEKDIAKILRTNGITIETRNTDAIGLELDIYIPDHKVAIEFNGLYWHSEANGKDAGYHINKTKLCESKGIQLIHVWEDEWVEKPDIVIDVILAKCGVIKDRIYARKTEIVWLYKPDADEFLNRYHIQGTVDGSVRLGLLNNNELVAVMVFGKTHSRNKTTAEWELKRYATKSGTIVVGGASKLLKHFIKEYSPKSIVSYADRCVSNGNMYHKLGFELVKINPPDYKYIKRQKRYHKQNFTKAKIKQKFGLSGGTEVEMMRSLGYYRIWDCGKMVFILEP